MEQKPWYKSKTLWAGVITSLIGVLSLIAELVSKATVTPQDVVLMFSGALVIALRVFFTDSAIQR